MLYYLLDWYFDRPLAYQNVLFRSTLALLTAFAVSVLVGPYVIRTLRRLKIGDRPEFYNEDVNRLMQMKGDTPTMGGVIILAGIFVGTLLWVELGNFYVGMGLFCLGWLGILGAADDYLKLTSARRGGGRDGLKFWEKMVFQVGLAVILAIYVFRHGVDNWPAELGAGPYSQMILPFYKYGLSLPIGVFAAIAVVVITGTSNAVNLTDGMDGLAAGCMGIVGFVFMLLTFATGTGEWSEYLLLPLIINADELSVICGALVGSCLGFLWFNAHPAQVFMGDTGSLAMGGFIGYVAVVTRQELMLLIVGGIFVIEAMSVILQVGYYKSTGGKRLFRMAPIHHHFHLKGWPETKVVIRFWLLAAMLAAFSILTVKLR
ncbi:MAG: phospho-N-acetylmuramoyl-pentapeptide-transferase [Phycisphaerae bacterium]|nr:phospho-N-acetylmuramoyl-pentapeptide-transferase [Phycisphaerae bacterium]